MLSTAPSTPSASPCYFTLPLRIPSHSDSLYSPLSGSPPETPADPTHPLLAYSLSSPASPNTATTFPSLLQMQSAAAHGQVSRPRPVPVQNVLQVSSDDSSGSDNSYSSRHSSSLELARCSRCQRTPSINVETGQNNMVQYGLNLWYCNRCAAMVGLNKR